MPRTQREPVTTTTDSTQFTSKIFKVLLHDPLSLSSGHMISELASQTHLVVLHKAKIIFHKSGQLACEKIITPIDLDEFKMLY